MAEQDDFEREEMIRQLQQPQAQRRTAMPGGIQAPVDPTTTPIETAPPVTTPTEPAAPSAPVQSYNMRGFDAGKMADPNKQSEKYKIGRIMQKYDPRGGVTPEMIAELNALGIAEFSGQGDKLTVNNTKNDPRFGRGGTADVVYGHKGQNEDTAWQPWFIDEGAAAGAPAGAAMGGGFGMGGGGMSTLDRIRGLMPTDLDFFNRLQGQAVGAVGGAGALDRDALIQMLTRGRAA